MNSIKHIHKILKRCQEAGADLFRLLETDIRPSEEELQVRPLLYDGQVQLNLHLFANENSISIHYFRFCRSQIMLAIIEKGSKRFPTLRGKNGYRSLPHAFENRF